MSKKPKTEPKQNGRPKIEIDWSKVDSAATAMCNGVEIAALLGISYDSLIKHFKEDKKNSGFTIFTDYLHDKKEKGKGLIKIEQFKKAKEGDNTMLVWLGKQHLDQRDKKDIKQETKDTTEQNLDLSKLTNEELREYVKLCSKLQFSKEDTGGTSEA